VGFNYRNAPAVMSARDMIAKGELGTLTHARFQLFSDYAAHPQGALTWRFERARGGNGVLGDLASHGVDMARFLLGEVASVSADSAIFVPERARPSGPTTGHTRSAAGPVGRVENEDYVACLMRMASGAHAVLEVSRASVGEQNAYGFSVHGTKGALSWDFRRMNELNVGTGDVFQDQPMSTVLVGPRHGFYGAFQPGAGIAMSYDDLKVVEAYQFLRSVVDGAPHGPTLDDALRSAVVLEAIDRSAREGTWASVPPPAVN
jgi:predicted dehydrogenase